MRPTQLTESNGTWSRASGQTPTRMEGREGARASGSGGGPCQGEPAQRLMSRTRSRGWSHTRRVSVTAATRETARLWVSPRHDTQPRVSTEARWCDLLSEWAILTSGPEETKTVVTLRIEPTVKKFRTFYRHNHRYHLARRRQKR